MLTGPGMKMTGIKTPPGKDCGWCQDHPIIKGYENIKTGGNSRFLAFICPVFSVFW
jgi:hypothetical protein